MAIKAEILQNILSNASAAKPVDGMKGVYNPEEYNKIMAKNRAMGLVNESPDGRFTANIAEGAVEFDEITGNLRAINRNAPVMIDEARYGANRYMVETIGVAKEGEKQERPAGTYIIVVLGEAVVKAIANVQELPPTIKAYRFKKTGKDKVDWKYVGAELIEGKVAYTMTKTLNAKSAIELRLKISNTENASENVEGDSLDDIK